MGGASSFSLLVSVSSLILLWSQSAEMEEERTTGTYSTGASVGLCLFSALVLACLTAADKENVKKATALNEGVLGVAVCFLLIVSWQLDWPGGQGPACSPVSWASSPC